MANALKAICKKGPQTSGKYSLRELYKVHGKVFVLEFSVCSADDI